jgi:hypothetical protein
MNGQLDAQKKMACTQHTQQHAYLEYYQKKNIVIRCFCVNLTGN